MSARASCGRIVSISLLLDGGRGRRGELPIGAQHVGREVFGDEAHLARGRTRRRHAPARPRSRLLLPAPPTAPRRRHPRRSGRRRCSAPPSEAILRATLPAPPILVSLRLDRDHRRGRLRRDPRHLAIDELRRASDHRRRARSGRTSPREIASKSNISHLVPSFSDSDPRDRESRFT